MLKAYTLHRPEEGYCQAQAPIAAVLLMHMPAEVPRNFPYIEDIQYIDGDSLSVQNLKWGIHLKEPYFTVLFCPISLHDDPVDIFQVCYFSFRNLYFVFLYFSRMHFGFLCRFVRSTSQDTTAQGW